MGLAKDVGKLIAYRLLSVAKREAPLAFIFGERGAALNCFSSEAVSRVEWRWLVRQFQKRELLKVTRAKVSEKTLF